MSRYIDAEKLKADIEKRLERYDPHYTNAGKELERLLSLITSLQQEQPEVCLEKLGEIARHLIAVKQNVEDMRLSEDEWLLLERIGYPDNARKKE